MILFTDPTRPCRDLLVHPYELDSSLVARSLAFGRAPHLLAIHVQITFVERHDSSWPWMRCEGDAVPLHDSIEWMLVAFISPDRAGYLVAGLFQQGHAGNRLNAEGNRDLPPAGDLGRSGVR